MLILLAVFFQSVFAASNMTLEVKQRIGALSATASTSSSDSLSEDEAIDLLLQLITFVAETIGDTIDNITLSIDNLSAYSTKNAEIANDNFSSIRQWCIIVGVFSLLMFLATWACLAYCFFCRKQNGFKLDGERQMNNYTHA